MKLKENSIFVPIGGTKFVHQPAKEKKGIRVGEVTVGVATIAIPIANFVPCPSNEMLKAMYKVAEGFPEVNFKVNFKVNSTEAFVVTITAKTMCREGDTYNEEVGKRIVNSKIRAIAFRVARRLAYLLQKSYLKWASHMIVMRDFFDNNIVKEKEYVSKALYLPKKAQE